MNQFVIQYVIDNVIDNVVSDNLDVLFQGQNVEVGNESKDHM